MHDTLSKSEINTTSSHYCQYCRRKYKSLKTLKNHEEWHKYKICCKLCLKRFRTVEEKEKHEKYKHQSKSKVKKCRMCPGTILVTEEDYLFHINEVHKGKYVDYYMCSDCGKQFKTKSELTSHITSKCGTIKQFKCQVCEQELMTAGSLHNHMLRHKGEPNFMCRYCAKLFLTAGQLKVHERIHTQDKAFICQVCGKGFCHRQSLITHSTLHTGIKPYQCENCGNSFSCVGNLLKHRKTHADSCGLVPLTTHRVKHPSTRMKVKVNTPANSRLKQMKKEKELLDKLNALKEKKLEQKKKFETQHGANDVTEQLVIKREIENETPTNDKESDANDPYCISNDHIDKPDVININDILNIIPTVRDNFMKYKDTGEIIKQEEEEERKIDHVNSDSTGADSPEHPSCENIAAVDFNSDISDSVDAKDLASRMLLDSELKDVTENLMVEPDLENNSLTRKSKRKSSKRCNNKNSLKITKQDLEKYMQQRKIQNKEDIVCQFCNKSYSNAKWLFRHEKIHHDKADGDKEDNDSEDVFKCNCCDASFNTRLECKDHQKLAHADMLTCQDCDKIFSNIVSLQIHKNNFHKGVPRKVYTYVCERCGRQFKQKASLVYHEENNCGSGPLIQCNVCEKSFSSIHVRKSHMRIHDAEKKLLCKFCGKSFHWKGQLKIHERSHTGEKPFSCLYCPKAFAYRESLITHSSLHTGIKPHLCEACGSRFSCIGNLIKHRATHVNTCGIWYSKNKT